MSFAAAILVLALDRPVLTLDQAVRTAEVQQPAVRQARAQREAAESRVAEARAPLLPQVATSISYQRTTGNRTLRAGTDPRIIALQPPPSTQLYDYFRFEVSATQLVYDFGQTAGQVASARALERAQEQIERIDHLSVVLGVRTAFFAALTQKRLVEVARETLENQKRHLSSVEGFVRTRVRPEIDLAQARLDVANAEVQWIGATNAYDAGRAQLNQAIGVEGSIHYELEETSMAEVPGEDGPLDALVGQALARRPELAGLREQASAQAALERSALGSYGPSLSVGVAASDLGGDPDHLRWNYYGIATLSWQLFQGMLTPARVAEARANMRAIDAQVDGMRQQVRLDVETAQLGVGTAKAALESARRALDSAGERLRLAEGRYDAGVGNAVELGDAILAQAAAAAQRVQADYLLATARAQLLRAVGRQE